MDKGNFLLIFSILFLSFEFLALMSYVIANQLLASQAGINDFRALFLEIALFGFLAYYFSVKKKK